MLRVNHVNPLTFHQKPFTNLIRLFFSGLKMNKSDLIEVVSSETGLKLKKAEEAVNTVFNGMADALGNG